MAWPKTNKYSKKNLEKIEIRKKCFELRLNGLTYIEIGEQIGVSNATAYRYVRDHVDKQIPQETGAEMVAVMSATLKKIQRKLMKAIDKGDLKHIDQLRKVLESINKLHGLDAPKKIEKKEEVTFEIKVSPAIDLDKDF